MPQTTLITIHRNPSEHLPICLEQARRSNPTARIVVLGDESNRGSPHAEHRLISDFDGRARELARHYEHLSRNEEWYELLCVQRWFLLAEFMERERLDSCFHMDSDLMVYADIGKEAAKFSQFQLTVNGRSSGHCSFINGREGLNRLCEFILSSYTGRDPCQQERMRTEYGLRLKHEASGGISDMYFLNCFFNSNPLTVGDTGIILEGATYDGNISRSAPHWQSWQEPGVPPELATLKQIYWSEGHPHCKLLATNEYVRFAVLHFQGIFKPLMRKCLR